MWGDPVDFNSAPRPRSTNIDAYMDSTQKILVQLPGCESIVVVVAVVLNLSLYVHAVAVLVVVVVVVSFSVVVAVK